MTQPCPQVSSPSGGFLEIIYYSGIMPPSLRPHGGLFEGGLVAKMVSWVGACWRIYGNERNDIFFLRLTTRVRAGFW